MNGKRKILIIENQYKQYEKILGYLKNEYEVYPKNKDEYIKFIDKVRVWINEEYHEDFINIALAEIVKQIVKCEEGTNNKIELILMDHILGGPHHCKTGIDLAIKLDENKTIKHIPIVFLSKTPDEEKNRLTGYESYKKKKSVTGWIHKGYFGEEILKKNYFKKNVTDKLPGFFEMTEKEKNRELLKDTISVLKDINRNGDSKYNEVIDKLELISDNMNLYIFTDERKAVLEKLKNYKSETITNEDIEIIKSIENKNSDEANNNK